MEFALCRVLYLLKPGFGLGGSCGRSNQLTFGFHNRREFRDQLTTYQLLSRVWVVKGRRKMQGQTYEMYSDQ